MDGDNMIQLFEVEGGNQIGEITEEQLQSLVASLEEESSRDQDYYLTAATIDMIEEDGADTGLVSLLRAALRGRDGMDIRWVRT